MSDFEKISEQMKSDWDRRVSHDYRFWMSDGHQDDQTMWESGARDFEILTQGIEDAASKTTLEIGCGVGRLLRAASEKFKKAIGFDVSSVAINKAQELLSDRDNIEFHVGNGVDLQPVCDNSVDVVTSFAAICSIPTDVVANYFREAHRVLIPSGTFRLQVYLGSPQQVSKSDTLHIRCFERANFEAAMKLAGFEVEWVKELKLPFQVSFKEIGIECFVCSLKRVERVPASAEDISQTLLPEGEVESNNETTITELEYWMTLNYANDLAEKGDIEKARETLEYAVAYGKTSALDTSDIISKIVNHIETHQVEQDPVELPDNVQPVISANFFEHNLSVLKERFPQVAEIVEAAEDRSGIELRETEQGPIIIFEGQCLDHETKPQAAAEAWAKRSLAETRFENAKALAIVGFASGYHIEALFDKSDLSLEVVEPNAAVFRTALEKRDLRRCIRKIRYLHVGVNPADIAVSDEAEMLVRPQTQVVASGFVNKLKANFLGERGIKALHPNIAVLGPIQGGTLPIAEYTARGLVSLNQRTRFFNMSEFGAGAKALDAFVNDELRQSILRGNYIEMLSQTILESLSEKPVDILICMAQAPLSGRALEEIKKRGIITALWFQEDYLRFTYWQGIARYFDFIFTIQRGECMEAIKQAGAGEVHYLPMACDPYIHCPIELTAEEKKRWGSPISFVGAGYHNRQQTFASFAGLPFKIWGTEWPECKPFDRMVQEGGRRLKPEEYIKIFNATDVNLNLHSSTERNGVDPYGDFLNPRTFELAAAGAFQLVDERTLLSEAFEIGEEIITFKDKRELREKMDYYLEHPEEREVVAKKARDRVLKEHTYGHRLHEMLSVIYRSKYEELKRKEASSPWSKLLERSKREPELHERCKIAFERGEDANLDALVSDIVTGEGALTETEQKLLFLFHVRKQIIRMKREEAGGKN